MKLTFHLVPMVLLVLFLHFRYLFFTNLTLSGIIKKKPYVPKIVTLVDVQTVEKINSRATNILNRVGFPNEFCLKSSTVLALCVMHLKDVQVVIGISKDNHTQGHAWVERQSNIISNDSDALIRNYLVIKRIDFRN